MPGSPAVIEDALSLIHRKSTKIYQAEKLQVSPDQSDNRFPECAVAAEADYLVTGNKRHFPAQWKNTLVIGARELVEILISQERG